MPETCQPFNTFLKAFKRSTVPISIARTAKSHLWKVDAEEQAGADDDGLARIHRRRASAAADERDTCVHEKVRDGRLIDEAALVFALAGVEDLLEEIRATRSVQRLTPP